MDLTDQAIDAVEPLYPQPVQLWQANAGEAAEEVETDDEVETEESDEEESEVDTDQSEDESEETEEEDSEETEEEFEEVEIDGRTYTVPKDLKDNLLMHSDYTRKTQEVAETRKQLEEREQQIQQQQERIQKNFQKHAQLAAIDQQLQQYEQVDWNRLQSENPELAQQHQFAYTRLKNQRDGVAADIQQTEQQEALHDQQETAKRMEQASRQLAGMVKDWSPQKGQEVANYMQQQGVSNQIIKYLNEARIPEAPQIIANFHKAMKYDQMLARTKKPAKKTPTKPSTKVKGKSKSRKPIDDPTLSTEERIKRWQAEKSGKK